MSALYGENHRAFQTQFETASLADRLVELNVTSEIPDRHRSFIESRDFFFLSTVDHRGFPTCSYKGGHAGFVRVLHPAFLAFPVYDGNGMFLSMGNTAAQRKVGMLFIDLETPHRLRLHGTASVTRDDPLTATFPGASLVVRVRVEEVFRNCPRYIHTYKRLSESRYVPDGDGTAPPPQWKRIDALQDALPPRDRAVAEDLGGVISPEQYSERLRKGEG